MFNSKTKFLRSTTKSPVRIWAVLLSEPFEIPKVGSLVCVELPLNCVVELPEDDETIDEQLRRLADDEEDNQPS